ncbi:8107_t:CDS:2 [Funneliformis mosseae]|uniref:8107_t:CDS:1 n=1 Tax=Funneliformis mosseae TaxID=27381 RepID=A0A9N8YN25_FUNMO|nr:8107_t:CDS:2 [Funneliformis mosseae]
MNVLGVYNEVYRICERYEDMVALKRLHGTNDLTEAFLNEDEIIDKLKGYDDVLSSAEKQVNHPQAIYTSRLIMTCDSLDNLRI